MENKVKLPSGAELKITVGSFEESKSLYQAILSEATNINLDLSSKMDHNFVKGLFCVGLSSKEIESRVWDCMRRCRYNNIKITQETFEPIENRQDYLESMYEVAKANVAPFTKSLYAHFLKIVELLGEMEEETENPK